jgi:hypothetical protein
MPNIKWTSNCFGDTSLIAVCQQTALQTEEEAVKFINYLWQNGFKNELSRNELFIILNLLPLTHYGNRHSDSLHNIYCHFSNKGGCSNMFDVDIIFLLINNDDYFFSLQIYTLHNVVHSQGIWGIIDGELTWSFGFLCVATPIFSAIQRHFIYKGKYQYSLPYVIFLRIFHGYLPWTITYVEL